MRCHGRLPIVFYSSNYWKVSCILIISNRYSSVFIVCVCVIHSHLCVDRLAHPQNAIRKLLKKEMELIVVKSAIKPILISNIAWFCRWVSCVQNWRSLCSLIVNLIGKGKGKGPYFTRVARDSQLDWWTCGPRCAPLYPPSSVDAPFYEYSKLHGTEESRNRRRSNDGNRTGDSPAQKAVYLPTELR